MRQITGNKLLVRALKEEGVDTIFGYPGACTIDISDELYKQDEIRVILPRHEQALVHEADAYARTTGKVGVCLVTSGPGATNLVTGLATANYDSVPLVCFTGQVARHLIGNDAFQEVDIVGITRSITKYGVTVRRREDLGRIIKEAFYIARTGRPGPVLIDLPKDVMGELGSAEYPKTVNIRGYKPNTSVHMGQLKRAIKMLKKAERPLFLAGGGVNIARANKVFTEVVDKTNVPVVTTIMGRGLSGISGCTGLMRRIWRSVNATFCSPSEQGSMTVSRGNSTRLRRRHRSSTSISIRPLSPEIYRCTFLLSQTLWRRSRR